MKNLIFTSLLFVFAAGMNMPSYAQGDQAGLMRLQGFRGKNQFPQMNNPTIMNNQQIGVDGTALSQQWPVEIIKSNLVGPWSRAGDFDNDNDKDIFVQNGDTLFWYENQQSGWSEHIIGSDFYNAEYAWVEAFDMDQDGDLDVLQYPMINPSEIVWNENQMNGLQWEKHMIDNTVNQPFNWSKAHGDIDQDGDIDLAVSSGGDGSVMWFENVSGDTSWQKRVIGNIGINALWTSLADMDGDNDLDIISATYSPGNIAWYENQLPNTAWTTHPITTLSGTAWGFCFDIDEDGDQDIVTHSNVSNILVWYENPSWTIHTITSGIPGLFVGPIGDIDQDGDPDVAFGGQSLMGWCENVGGAAAWVTNMIDTVNNLFPSPIDLADINGDGYLDLTAYTVDGFGNGIGDARWYSNPFGLPGVIRVPEDFPTIQAGIDAASDGDTVVVADSTYYENISFKGKAITVASHFIMDGDTNHINNTIIDGSQPNHPDSGSVVYFISGEDTNSVLCGFTITGGTGTVVQGDLGGGGIFAFFGGGRICNNIIENNTVISEGQSIGGGVSSFPYFAIIENNIIRNNYSESSLRQAWGGGVFLQSDGRINGNIITGNEVTDGGTATSYVSYGGGVSCFWPTGGTIFVTLNNNIISNNKSTRNSAAYGGGVSLIRTESNFSRNTVSNNVASTLGGGIYINDCSPNVYNNLIVGNEAASGGGIRIYTPTTGANPEHTNENPFSGAAFSKILVAQPNESRLQINNTTSRNIGLISQPQIINNTIGSNTATSSGGGIYSTNSEGVIMNSILWGDAAPTGPEIYVSSGSIGVSYSDVQGGYSGTGNINVDPVFADTVDYYLSFPSSPAVDAGNSDPSHDDPEDPNNPGFACFPALGTISNDMGAYGGPGVICTGPTAVGIFSKGDISIPERFVLSQNYPNPFNPSTTIEFNLPEAAEVKLTIYNSLGQQVRKLFSDRIEPGKYQVVWDGRNDSGAQVSSGVYLYRMVAGDYVQVRKMILMK